MNRRLFCLLAGMVCITAVPALSQEVYGEPDAPVAGKVLEIVIHTSDADDLRYVILKALTHRYAEEKGITVTQAERDAYVASLRKAMERDRQLQAERRGAITRKLEEGGLSEAEQKSLAMELEALNEFLANSEAMDASAGEQDEKAARDRVASAFIRQWKLNRALYQDYGGRIIFQQGGPEPLDAYRRFLEERQRQGAFAILNPELEDVFWRYYRDDAIHSFYASGSEEEAKAFAVPWWLISE